jgi:dihydropteroate synthase
VALGYPILLGASRKRFIAALDPLGAEPRRPPGRLAGRPPARRGGRRGGGAGARRARDGVQALAVWSAIQGA